MTGSEPSDLRRLARALGWFVAGAIVDMFRPVEDVAEAALQVLVILCWLASVRALLAIGREEESRRPLRLAEGALALALILSGVARAAGQVGLRRAVRAWEGLARWTRLLLVYPVTASVGVFCGLVLGGVIELQESYDIEDDSLAPWLFVWMIAVFSLHLATLILGVDTIADARRRLRGLERRHGAQRPACLRRS